MKCTPSLSNGLSPSRIRPDFKLILFIARFFAQKIPSMLKTEKGFSARSTNRCCNKLVDANLKGARNSFQIAEIMVAAPKLQHYPQRAAN